MFHSSLQGIMGENVTVSNAIQVAANGNFSFFGVTTNFEGSSAIVPRAACIFQANVLTPGNTSYKFGMMLPHEWNGSTAGNAGFAGSIGWSGIADALYYGFAAVSTDTGHMSEPVDASWSYKQPEKFINWGYRALHGTVVHGKAITESYYGKKILYSYYRGCSAGGKQGFKEVEMFPDDFNGVIAGAPAWWTIHLQLWNGIVGYWNTPVNSAHHIDQSLFFVLENEVLKQCDPQDGVVDHIIQDPFRCTFRPETLLCAANVTNSTAAGCFTSAQLETIYKWYSNWVESNDTFVFPPFTLSSEWQWALPVGLLGSNTPSTLGSSYIGNMLGLGPDWTYDEWNPSIIKLSDEINPGNATANNFDISPFYKKGGKLIHYHGLSDGSIATGSSVYLYDHILRSVGPQSIDLDDFYRFFLVPGMGHCAGTSSKMSAPWYFNGDGQAGNIIAPNTVHGVPGFEDAQHDVVLAIMAWVENGTAPNHIIATRYVNDTITDGVERQRPLCVYPEQAMYTGNGDVNKARSWACKKLY